MSSVFIKVHVSERLPKEEWRDVVGYEEYYEVSNFGNIKSKDRIVKGRLYKSKNLKLSLNNSGYYTVCIKIRSLNISKTKTVHRTVLEAFVPNVNNYPEINHKDFDTSNNNVENLEWCTHEYNMRHMYLNKPPRRDKRGKNKNSKPISMYNKEGEHIRNYDCIEDVKEYGFTPACVTRVCQGIRPQHKGFIFRYGANLILESLKAR